MSVSLTPSSSLGFPRPFNQLVKRTLTISNPNPHGLPIAFKVKTTAPKLYCVRPNSGRVEPGEHVEISVMLQAMKEEPPISAKCKDKFLIQSTYITPEKETMPLPDIWNVTDSGEDTKVHQQKLKVVYLPAEGQILEEEDETQPNQSSFLPGNETQLNQSSFSAGNDSRYDTVRQVPTTNGHSDAMPEFEKDQGAATTSVIPVHEEEPERTVTPPADFSAAPEEQHAEEPVSVINVNVHPPPPSPPTVERALTNESHPDAELVAKYAEARAEIEHLRAQLAAVPSPQPELRRRNRALSDDGSTVIAETEVGTMIDDGPLPQEGVPLQVVIIIALGVFSVTYLFF